MIYITLIMNILSTLTKAQTKHIKYINLKKDVILYHENDLCESIGIVIEGEISIISYLENGKEILYNIVKEDESFGSNLIFSKSPYYKGNIIASKPSKIALISKEQLFEYIQNNKSFAIEFLKSQANFTISLNETIKLLSLDKAEDRLLYHMHSNNGKIEYKNVGNLARKLYLQRETLSRLLSKLEKENKIKRDKKNIILTGDKQ